jgi:hypothetical protein
MGVDVLNFFPPHLNPPPPWREELFFGSIGARVSHVWASQAPKQGLSEVGFSNGRVFVLS